jgi:hypothetical protein
MLARYEVVDLIMGKQKETSLGVQKITTDFKTFTPELQAALRVYQGNLLCSGAYIGSDMRCKADTAFTRQVLHYEYRTHHATRNGNVRVALPGQQISGKEFSLVMEQNPTILPTENPDAIRPAGKNAKTCVRYDDSGLGAGVQYEENGQNFRDFLSSVRGKAIQNLIDDVAVVFANNYEQIMEGTLDKHLIDLSRSDAMRGIFIAKRLGRERIYPDRRKTELEVGSYTTLSTVLDSFISGVHDYRVNVKSSYRASRIVRLIGNAKIGQSVTTAEAYHQVLDFVSGMTDNYATYLARQIGGLVTGL